jgi:hypothetical protein
MSMFTTLSVTTSAGTATVKLGNESKIRIDSPNGPAGTPAAASRTPHEFVGFLQFGPNRRDEEYEFSGKLYPAGQFKRVSGLSYAAGVITVTETGHAFTNVPAANLASGAVRDHSVTDPAWTKTTNVSVANASTLVFDGVGPGPNSPIPLAGLSAISLVEAS